MGPEEKRTYLATHPWIRFAANLAPAPAGLWMLLGEARSKCEHLAGVPLQPDTAKKLHTIYLAKGLLATTAIEGNSLSEDDVHQLLDDKLKLPPSKEYLANEVRNVLDASNAIWAEIAAGTETLTPERICEFNAKILRGLPAGEGVVPGEIRKHSVVVGSYRGAPASDCWYLLERLCEWLSGNEFKPSEQYGIVPAIIAAVMAHLYIAWIHPFGDGNGRTARLVELQILSAAGVPKPAAQLFSNHYNETRAEYYRQLQRASMSNGDVIPFLEYAVQGFVDQLKEQLTQVRMQQFAVAWENYVFAQFHGLRKDGDRRRRDLLLALAEQEPLDSRLVKHPTAKVFVSQAEIMGGPNPKLARLYIGKTSKTLSRDLRLLSVMKLIERTEQGVRAKTEAIHAFLPACKIVPLPTPLASVPAVATQQTPAVSDEQLPLLH